MHLFPLMMWRVCATSFLIKCDDIWCIFLKFKQGAWHHFRSLLSKYCIAHKKYGRQSYFSSPKKFAPYQFVWYLIIYMKPFLHSDWLRAVQFFLKQCRKELIQSKTRKQTKHSDWSMISETHRWPIKSFVFKSSARPGWRNWWRNFSLIAWYAFVSSAQPSRNFFMYISNK